MNDRIEELEKELKLLREIEELKNKPKFEVGKWYKLTSDYGTLKKDMVFMYVRHQDDDNKYPFVIVNHQMFGELSDGGGNYIAPNKDQLIEATNEEVETALIKEAKKRGFKDDTKITAPFDYSKYEISVNSGGFVEGVWGDNILYNSNGVLFNNGKWATIIDTPLTISGHEMKQDGDIISFGCAKLNIVRFEELYDKICIFDRNPNTNRKIKSITLDSDVTITVKELEEIVDNIK